MSCLQTPGEKLQESQLDHSKINPGIKNLFKDFQQPSVPLAGRLRYFTQNWRKLTNDSNILSIVEGLKLEFLEEPKQNSPPFVAKMTSEKKQLMEQEIQDMLRKGAITPVKPRRDQFLSSVFLREKKDGSQRPIINLKCLNQFIPYIHFKMESISNLRDLLEPNDLMIKIDLKDAYFTIPIHESIRKHLRFVWEGTIFEFICLCFGLGPGPRIFTKLMKVPITILRRLNIRLIIYLDDMLILARTVEEALSHLHTVIYLLENLGFVINKKKSAMTPSTIMEFLGFIINSKDMTISLPEEKITNIKNKCTQISKYPKTTLRKLTKFIGTLTSTSQAILPAPIKYRNLQQCQIRAVKKRLSMESYIWIDKKALEEIKWWMENIDLHNGKAIKIQTPDMIITSDAATTGGWGAQCQRIRTGGLWTTQELKNTDINILEMRAAMLAIQTFTKGKKDLAVHLKSDNTTTLSYLAKMGGTKNLTILGLTQEIWEYLLTNRISLTVEYIPGKMNTEADWESRNHYDSSEWKLDPQIFQQLCKIWGTPEIDLYASRTSHQLTTYYAWKPDPHSKATDAMQQNWTHLYGYAFPPFSMIGRTLRKALRQRTHLLLIAPMWQSQTWYPLLMRMAIADPILLPTSKHLLTNPSGEQHPLLAQGHLHLSAWRISGNITLQEQYRQQLPPLSTSLEDQALEAVTQVPGLSGKAGVSNGKLIPLNVL